MSTQNTNINSREIKDIILSLLKPWIYNESIDAKPENLSLISDLGLDSIAILQFILSIEKQFHINIANHELDSVIFAKLKKLIALVEKKLNDTL